jgi:hypothetical protein
MTPTRVSLLYVLVGLCLLAFFTSQNPLVEAVKKENTAFRCFRPFGALSTFKPSAMKGRENCIFEFMEIKSATAVPTCRGGETSAEAGCKVRVEVEALRIRKLKDFSDSARYTLELRSVNDSTINYKGFDGNGYSLCCAFIDDSRCEWVEEADAHLPHEDVSVAKPKRQRLKPKECSVFTAPTFGEADQEQGSSPVIKGHVEKPLHTYSVGHWEAKLTFWRDQEIVGKLSIPFQLTQEDVQKITSPTGNTNANSEPLVPLGNEVGVGAAEALAVVTVKDSSAEGGADDKPKEL